jgi:hypothetical protein
MNRPYGAVDVSANLKGAVAKTNVQKILLALTEKGELVQKTYGSSVALDIDLKSHFLSCILSEQGKPASS